MEPAAKPKSGRSTYQRHPKPPYSYIAMIAMAIRDSEKGKLTLAEINEYLMRKFPFFRGEYQGWKNSIRHNLSLNECFVKILRDTTRPWGKDNYWMLNPDSEYTFADGVFRRRRKRLWGLRDDDREDYDADDVFFPEPPIKCPNTSPHVKLPSKSQQFSIENLLKNNSPPPVKPNAVPLQSSIPLWNANSQVLYQTPAVLLPYFANLNANCAIQLRAAATLANLIAMHSSTKQ